MATISPNLSWFVTNWCRANYAYDLVSLQNLMVPDYMHVTWRRYSKNKYFYFKTTVPYYLYHNICKKETEWKALLLSHDLRVREMIECYWCFTFYGRILLFLTVLLSCLSKYGAGSVETDVNSITPMIAPCQICIEVTNNSKVKL